MKKIGWLAMAMPIATAALHGQQLKQPNIILIVSDDMGYSDIGCYGGLIETPNLDRLAQEGLQYMQFYNTARSCPSRASLMTGLHPHQTGIGHMTDNRGQDGYRGDLNRNCVTLAEVLGRGGYETYAVGKWHLTRFMKSEGPKHNWPLQRGFDHFYGTIAGGGSYFDPHTLCRGNQYVTVENDPEYKTDGFYYTDAITDNAIRFLQQREKNDQQPYFMYVAYTSAHWPMHVPEEEVEAYKGRFDKGWDELRREKYRRMQKEKILKKGWELSKDRSVKSWDSVKNKAFETRCMEVYAAIVTRMDRNIGRLVDYLRATGQLENTVLVFLQDNGGCAETLGRDRPVGTVKVPKGREVKPMAPDELQRDLIPYRTRDGKPVRWGFGTMPGGADTYISYGKGWAYLSDAPFKEYKHWVHEGGIATPLIVHWPAGIKHTGKRRWQPGQLPDIMATFVDLAGAAYPETYAGNKIFPCEGKSLVPSFEKDMPFYERPLFWEHEGNRAIRVGKWKLVYKEKGQPKEISPGDWELYDMEKDRTEVHNVAAENPEVVQKMAAQWEDFAVRCRVKPWPGAYQNN